MSRKLIKKKPRVTPVIVPPTPPPAAPQVPLPPATARPLMADLMDAMTLRVVEAGRGEAARTQQQAILHKLIQDAAAGDTRAAQILIALKREGDAEKQGDSDAADFSAEDQAVLDDYARQMAAGAAGETA